MALRLNTSEKNEIMPRRKARAEKPRLAQMLLRSGSLAGVESIEILLSRIVNYILPPLVCRFFVLGVGW